MKITLPKQVIDLGMALSGRYAECERIRADIERAAEASADAERLAGELEALGQRRAELKAQAFISRQPADLTELNAKEEELERASRSAREDGAAAAIAITLLNTQLEEAETAIGQITEQRRVLALAWLEDRRERAMDRYIKALTDLGSIIAEAAAADRARSPLGDIKWGSRAGTWLLDQWGEIALPLPTSRMTAVGDPQCPRYLNPITWPRDKKHLNAEWDALAALFREAGLLPPIATAAAIEEAATPLPRPL